ncbi:NAD(P)/FAD-dependent oxidoreductase [Halococcus sediminicola]|uniref:NAD(P)/FAD-dependent oxidoreductase n=1 Tax=Halococcus sediminicola TaxID=1264579 RepID=UPI000679939A|nr:FAD-dependent oxidoreductase [Halococcus sediminicola]
MTETVVVLGAGYAGAGAIMSLEDALGEGTDLVWVSDNDYHLVLHEAHRCIRDPNVQQDVTIPVEAIKSPSTRFIEGEVTGLDCDEREISLGDGSTVAYDYALVTLGSQTAYYGIDGLKEHSLTLKGLDDAFEIHDQIKEAARDATDDDPARVVVGGAGLSGIQTAGEVAEFRDMHHAPIEITLVEALEEIFPGNDPELQGALRKRLLERDVEISTDDPITEADEEEIHFQSDESLAHDVFVWTGGITGREAMSDANLENEHNRVNADATFETSDDRVFALGDSAIVDQPGGPCPPTAQAAWQAAEVAGENVARALHGQPLAEWTHEDKGTVVSVGDKAVAHDVVGVPVNTFGGPAAEFLKKAIAARWIRDVGGTTRAARAWSDL